ncbi:competence protein ComGF [Sporosarcina sp. NCCP-2222]|uniref:competence type IV pilus minor pilin ComGF n=1 Tax=Sporosarcina sp. NCCP-2222 TaxID=2935073 RepID=UPI00208B0C52|nr:competence type IV pilus minor pilin ComGF [Sporosarcina sp. NCCP-2222]GKV54212.1 competence protein ComGF [Sporosarcina sp. NCCP-2222]
MLRLLKRESGYTLLDSLFQLIIAFTFLHLLVLFFYWKQTIEQHYGTAASTEWELFTAELQTSLAHVESISLSADGQALMYVNERGVQTISLSGTVIRRTVDFQGHIPLFTNIRSLQFSLEEEMVRLTIVTLDEKIKERRFAIGLFPE